MQGQLTRIERCRDTVEQEGFRLDVGGILLPGGHRDRVLGVIGLNPSKAGLVNDPTVSILSKMASTLGFTTLLLGNLYPFVATAPAELAERGFPNTEENDRALLTLMRSCDRLLCIWGANAQPERAETVLRWARAQGLQPMALGFTRSGQPRHTRGMKLVQSWNSLVPITQGDQ